MTPRTRLIIAMDVLDKEKALAIAEETHDLVDAYKVNYPLILACGMGIVEELVKYGPVICDFKIADIDNTNRLIIEQIVKAGASGLICHGFVGDDALEACVDAACDKDVYVVAEMSHPGATQFIQPVAHVIAMRAVQAGAAGIIAPGTRPERLKKLRDIVGDLLILTPGIGAQGGSARQAIEAGADAVIVGRAIYNAQSPREAAQSIIREIEGA